MLPETTQPGIGNDPDQYENAVFVSYAWEGESESTVDELERAFAERGIRIVRDKKDLGYKGSIEEFEQRIGRGKCIVLVINDKYLRSEHCMYELAEINENQGLRERVFPIVLSNARIYKAIDRLSYIKYWDEQIEQLSQAIKEVKLVTNLAGIAADLDKYARIRASFDHLTDLLGDMNALTPEIHTDSGFATLISAVESMSAPKPPALKAVPPAASAPASKPSTNRQVLYQDDFSNPKSGWDVGKREGGITLGYEAGAYQIYLPEDDSTWVSYSEQEFGDFELEVEIAKIKGPKDGECAVQCRVSDYGGYGFWITSEGYYGIYKIYFAQTEDTDDEYVPLADGDTTALHTGTAFNQLRAVCAGNTLTMFLNGEKVLEALDDEFESGVIGLVVTTGESARGGLDIRFKNLIAHEP